MPSTPTTARNSSTRRKSTKPSLDDPSTSFESPTEDGETITKKDEIRAFLVGRLLAMMRDHRDSTESKIAEKAADKIAPLNEHIYKLEQRACGMTLEEMVKDTQYASYSILNVAGEISSEMEKEKAALKNQKTLEPIEVKIEDTVVPQPESNVERAAKREAHVLARIAELRRNGMWSNSRLPKCVEPERNKTHWDYLLEEVKWMATDFRAEMSMKRQTARKLASAIAKVHREQEIEVERSEQKAIRDKKKLCASVAKMVRDFWQNVNKVVDIRAKEVIESRVRKERNKHLMLIIGQVNEMSTIVQEGLQKSKTPSVASNADDEFSVGEESESDDERTIANAEKSLKTREVKDEVDALTSEANANIDDVLASLPPEYLAAYGVTSEDIEEMKRQNVAVEQEEVQEEEEEQDEKKENNEGNGDGRGVLQNVNYEKLNSVNSDERQKELANIAEEALKFQPKGYTLETTQVKTPVPFLVRGTLREYQMVGLDWLVTLYEKNLNGILADEMGLGKTIQTISLLAHLACSESIWGPHLIVVPTSVILNWEMEFKKWCPALKILTYFGSAKDRAEKRKGWLKPNCFHVCITSYKTVTTDIRVFKKRGWQYMILDEAQNIKNWKSQRWQALLNVRARRRLLLTGTPLQNSLMELWSLMHFLMPTIFSSHDDFQDWFSNPLTGMMEGNAEFNAPLIQQLHKVLRPFILRRLKSEVEKQLPAKTEHIIKCSLSKRQRYLYDDFMSRRSTKENLKSGNMMSVLNIVMQLRKCCNHPNLFEPRQVVSPFVLNPRRQELPACLFEMTRKDNDDENIPDCLNIMKRVNAHGTAVRSKKPLIEEMEDEEEVTVRPPLVEGFKLNRTCFEEHSEMEASEEERAGFHCRMAAETSRLKLKEHGAMSPPIKKPKLTGTAPNLSDYVPRYVIERMEKEKRNRLEIARRRFDKIEEPILSAEVLSILRVKGKHAGRQEKRMMKFIEMAAERFGLYVEPVLTDAFECRPSSSGLPSYIRNNMEMVEVVSKSMLQQQSELDDRLLVSRMLQFPELRLIEYDCGKLQTLALLLRQLYLHKHRCLIFTQMSRMLDVLQMFLAHHGYQYFRLDGSTGIEQRQAMMERFNADEKIFCFILSTRSGGVGVNLTGADTVIFYDSDWNPTMDAQAQDRCHRIGQTRNVSIYRLISERTIEENILKKAIQKRRLGELAIDQAGFTPDFFKQSDSIRDLFTGENVDVQDPLDVPSNEKELESAMANCEDDVDVTATKMATAEANVDTAEFEEAAKNATTSHLGNEEDVDEKYLELINQLKPIERYAVGFMEEEYKPEFEEEEKEALALIEQKREEWNQKAEQQVAEDVDDDDFYLGGNLLDEILAQGIDDETMPSWLPPSPPLSDEDEMKFDETFDLLYEIDPMNETRLPSQIHELRRPLMERQKVQNDILSPLEVKPPPPEERFSPVFADSDEDYKKKRRRDARRNNEVKRATTPPPPTKEEEDYDGAEWCIIEDYELLRAVQNEMTNMHDLERSRNHAGMMLNWELVASAVNRHTRFYRSARQCCIRYQMFVRPKELGQLVTSDPITKRTVKVDLTPTELSHLRKGRVSTEQQFVHDCASILEKKHVSRFKMVKSLKKPTSFWRGAKEAREPVGKIPEDHEKKLESLDVKLETNWDVEELGEVVTETKKKDKLREGSPKPRTNVFIERPHVFKVAKGEKLAPRGHRVINVPPLQTLPQFVPHQQAPQQIMRRASTSQGIYQSNYVMMNTAGPEGGAQTQRIVPQTTRAYSTNAPVVVQTAQRGQQRVFRSGMTGRVMMQNADRGTAFTASNVRLMHPTQRVVAPGARRAQPQPGTVAAMVMSNRGGAVSHLRSIPRNYQGQNRINLMVGPQGQLRQQGHIVTSGNAVKRQLMTTARPGNREQSVAQVVLAPPTSNSSSQPPILHVQPRTQQQEPQTQAPQPPPTNNQ